MAVKRKASRARGEFVDIWKRKKLMREASNFIDATAERDVDAGTMTVELMRHQKRALEWMLARESSSTRGGILADDQGLGKTISTIALLLTAGARSSSPAATRVPAPAVKLIKAEQEDSDTKQEPKPEQEEEDGVAIGPVGSGELVLKGEPIDQDSSMIVAEEQAELIPGGTLIVCPLSVLRQWEREIGSKVSPSAALSTLVYHGESRSVSPGELASYDVVITTYGVVSRDVPFTANEFTKDDCGPDLRRLRQMNKELELRKLPEPGPLSMVSWHRVVLDEAQSIRNSYTQVSMACRDLETKFRWGLSGTPLQNTLDDLYAFFRFHRVPPYNTCNSFLKANEFAIKAAFQSIVLRRSKSSFIDGKPLLHLPPRVVNRVTVNFSPLETETYEMMRKEFQDRIKKYQKTRQLGQRRFTILAMLLRLRQMCDSPELLVRKSIFPHDEPDYTEFDEMDIESPDRWKKAEEIEREFEAMQLQKQMFVQTAAARIGRSAKVKAALEVLAATPAGEKTLIFSQWTSMLDVMEPELEKTGIRFTRIDGTMTTTARDAAIKKFSEDPGVTVMLLSLKAAGCGLNLIAASRVVLLDMWWNPTSEDQAIDRTHRIGQTKPVHVTKFYVEHSLEKMILEIQMKKKSLVEFTFDEKIVDETSLSMAQLVALFRKC